MYLQLVSLHGLIRKQNIEMGRDADTGGQIRYVLELAKALAERPEVEQVDLFTRRIRDKRVSEDYGRDIEAISPKCRIVRLACGGPRYIRKEKLWPVLDEFIDAMISFTRQQGLSPTLVHGHYADAGYVAKEVAATFDAPFIFTGHSLGKPKLDYLLDEGWTPEKADKELAINQRIEVEQECATAADLVITSTKHERDSQYGKYKTDEGPTSEGPTNDEGANFEVIPPGTDLERFFPYYEYEMPSAEIDERFKQARMRMTADLGRFHLSEDKPLILALCRPDRRKNIGALLDAYGQSKELQAIANLAIFAGIRDNIEEMPENEQQVLTDMLLAMDRYNLYGKLAIPKRHNSEFDVPELYRLTAASRGIFVNSAFIELFGLTAIEASATGLPFVVTANGGPQDIAENCQSGLLVDVNDSQQMTDAMLKLLTDHAAWDRASANGVNLVRKHYSWQSHVDRYMSRVKELIASPGDDSLANRKPAVGRRLASLDSLLITDIDNTLIGDDKAFDALMEVMRENRDRIGFGIASGRSRELVEEVLHQYGVDDIDVIISSVGAEVYYGREMIVDRGWASHLRSKWKPEKIHAALNALPFLTLQERDHAQREFKISYDLDDAANPGDAVPLIHNALKEAKLSYSLIFSHGTFVDILPSKASKGKAVQFLSRKWNIPLEKIATAGDSGNDRDMLIGKTAGIVVANYDKELENLRQSKPTRVYYASTNYAAGILEGLKHYKLIDAAKSAMSLIA